VLEGRGKSDLEAGIMLVEMKLWGTKAGRRHLSEV
jgi:hypothetical protein